VATELKALTQLSTRSNTTTNWHSLGPTNWSRGEWPKSLEEAVEKAVECEPRDDVRERMEQVLRGEPLSP
jgi:hypothetical protein